MSEKISILIFLAAMSSHLHGGAGIHYRPKIRPAAWAVVTRSAPPIDAARLIEDVIMGYLFASGNLRGTLARRTLDAGEAVGRADPDALRFSPESVGTQIAEDFDVVNLVLHWDQVRRSEVREVPFSFNNFGYSGQRMGQGLTIYVPFGGDPMLFQMQPSTFTMSGTPDADINGTTLSFQVSGESLTTEAVQSIVQSMRSKLDQHVGWINNDLDRWRPGHTAETVEAAVRRKARLDAQAELSSALDIPLHATSQAKAVNVPVARKSVRPTEARKHNAANASADPALSDAIYEDVLKTLRSVGNSFERLPSTAARFDEEELRDLLLFILNSNYEGAAAGEVFNGAGKTDVLIRHQDRNAFIGECKMWRGQKAFMAGVDQLLSYTVWRDTKAALILFIKKGDATAIIAKADETIRSHDCFISAREPEEPDARRDFLLHAKDDDSRTIKLAFMPIVVRTETVGDTETV